MLTSRQIVETITGSPQPFDKLHKGQQLITWEISGSLVFLLGALATARDEIAVAIAADQTILRLLFCLTSFPSVPRDLHDEVLQCLMLLAEDSLPFGQALISDKGSHPYEALLKLIEGSGLKAALACGVLHNTFTSLRWQDHSPGQDGACDALLVPTLSRILAQTAIGNGKAGGQEGASPVEILQTALEVLASIGTDFQGALEQGNRASRGRNGVNDATAMVGDDEDEEDEEMDDAMDVDASEDEEPADEDQADEDEEIDSDALDEDMEKVAGGDDDTEPDAGLDDLPTLRELRSAVAHVIRLTQATLTSDDMVAVQGHAISTLNNIAWTVSCIDFSSGENESIFKAWSPVAQAIWTKTVAPVLESDNADLDLATATTSLAWALSRSLGGSTPLKGDEHRKFISLYRASKSVTVAPSVDDGESADPFQSLGVKCVGVLGQLARDPAPLSLNRDIGVFLLTVLASPEAPPADAIEAANQILDIYADEQARCDEVFWKDNFLEHLEEALPKMRSLAKSLGKPSGELKQRADEVVLNLNRFIAYKKKHMPKEAKA